MNCGRLQAEPPPQGLGLGKRIWYYDIESTKMTVELETFELHQRSEWLPWASVKRPPFLICWSGAWITTDTTPDNIRVFSSAITAAEAMRGCDKRIAVQLRDHMDKADRWAGHNVKSFDSKKVHTRLMLNHIPAADLTIKQIDTLTLARKHLKNDSNALGYWLERLGQTGKDKMVSEDWDLCKAGNQRAIRKMQRYNKQDVRGGVILFLELRDYLASGGVDIFK